MRIQHAPRLHKSLRCKYIYIKILFTYSDTRRGGNMDGRGVAGAEEGSRLPRAGGESERCRGPVRTTNVPATQHNATDRTGQDDRAFLLRGVKCHEHNDMLPLILGFCVLYDFVMEKYYVSPVSLLFLLLLYLLHTPSNFCVLITSEPADC